MEEDKQIAEMAEKMKAMTEALNEKVYQNPIKEVQQAMLQEALQLKKILLKNINDLSKGQPMTQIASNQSCNSEEYNTMKTALDHKVYQVERLKEAFNEYEARTESEITQLKTENDKLRYRINILLRELEQKEKK